MKQKSGETIDEEFKKLALDCMKDHETLVYGIDFAVLVESEVTGLSKDAILL